MLSAMMLQWGTMNVMNIGKINLREWEKGGWVGECNFIIILCLKMKAAKQFLEICISLQSKHFQCCSFTALYWYSIKSLYKLNFVHNKNVCINLKCKLILIIIVAKCKLFITKILIQILIHVSLIQFSEISINCDNRIYKIFWLRFWR